MAAARQDGMPIASLWRRGLASLISVVCGLSAVVALPGAVFLLHEQYRTRAGSRGERYERAILDGVDPERWTAFFRRWRAGFWLLSLVFTVRGRNRRGPGARLLGIRRVDARTGGPVSVRAALVRFAVEQTITTVSRRLSAPTRARAEQRSSALSARLAELEREHAADPEALAQGRLELHASFGHNPLTACAPQLPAILGPQLPALFSPRNQTLVDRLSGTVVVRDAQDHAHG